MRYLLIAMLGLTACGGDDPARPHHADDGVVWCAPLADSSVDGGIYGYTPACGDVLYPSDGHILFTVECVHGMPTPPCSDSSIPPPACRCIPYADIGDGGVAADH